MRVLHVIPSVSTKEGGPAFSLSLMILGLIQAGVKVDVATTDDDGWGARLDVPLGRPVASPGGNHFYFRRQTQFYKCSFPLGLWLSRNVHQYDLIHVHALFSFSSCAAALLAARKAVPYVVGPLGVLNRWGMENRRRLLKSLSFRLLERPLLRRAAAIHYTSVKEQAEAERIGAPKKGVVIPLGIDVAGSEPLPGPERFFERFPAAKGRDVLLYLSRLDPIKGLDLLLPAFAETQRKFPRCFLVLAGTGPPAFVNELRKLAEHLQISDHVLWAGFLEGSDKWAAFSAATLFVLPSYSENFGIAALEALAAGVPTIISDQVGMADEVERFEAGRVVGCNIASVTAALQELVAKPDLRNRLSRNARQLAQDRFSLTVMGRELADLYSTIINRRGALPPTG